MADVAFTQAGTLLDRARQLYRDRPDRLAVAMVGHDEDRTVSYGEFLTRAASYAHALEAVGIRPGDLVVLVLQHGEDTLYSFWGAMLLGAAPSIFPFLTEKLDPARYFDSVQQLVRLSEVRVVITYRELESALRQTLAGIETLRAILAVEDLQPGGDVAEYLSRNPARPEDTAFLQHSSGSTGLQKGVMLSHRAVLNQIAGYSEAIDLRPDDVVVSWLPLYHDMGLIAGFMMPLLTGIPLVLMSPFQWVRDPGLLLRAIHRYRGTLCWLPNFAYNFMALRVRDRDIEGVDLSSCRAVINCSEPVYAESHRVFLERYAPYGLKTATLMTCYAMAENTFAVTQSPLDRPLVIDTVDRHILMEQQQAVPVELSDGAVAMVSCGIPIPGCEVCVMDEGRQLLPDRRVGEIALRSNSMLTGYYRRPELTAQAIFEGWYYTGDMGYLAGGELYITGRKKDLVIIGGKNIYPQDIENLLNTVEGIHAGRSVAFGVPNPQLGTEDLAIVAETDHQDAEKRAAMLREIRMLVVKSMDVAARYVHLVDRGWLVKTSSGKVARRANREKFMGEVLGLPDDSFD